MATRKATPRKAKPAKGEQREVPASFSIASALPSEKSTSVALSSYVREDYELVARALCGTAALAAEINSRACAGQKLRLYRAASGGGEKRFWKGRRVAGDRAAARVKAWRGSKAAEFADDSGGEMEEVRSAPVLDLVNKPDPNTTSAVWFNALYWFRQVAGRCYVYMGEQAMGVPLAGYLMYPQYTRTIYDNSGRVVRYRYGRDQSAAAVYDAEEVDCYRTSPNKVNPLGAASWVASVLPEIELEAAALQSELARWQNGSFPGLILEANENTTDDQVRQLSAALEGAVRGVAKSGSPLVLRATKATPFGHKPNEMGYVVGQERAEKRIYDAAGIPEPIYRLNAANLASATVALDQYMRLTILPMINGLADELTTNLLPRFGMEPGEYWFGYDSPVAEDVDATADRLLAGMTAGAVTVNEYRRALGLDPVDDGDELRAPPSPFGLSLGNGGTSVPNPDDGKEPPEPDGEGEGDGGRSEGAGGAKSHRCAGEACGCGVVDCGRGSPPPVVARQADKGQLEARRKAWRIIASRKAARVPMDPETGLPKSMLREVDALAGDLDKWYTGAYRELAGTVDAVGNVGNLSPATMEALQSTVSEGLVRILNEAAKVAVVQINGDPEAFALKPETAIEYARKRGGELIVTVPNTMRSVMGEQVAMGLEVGESIAAIRDRVAAQAPELAGWQAERIARTESSVAYQEGKVASWAQLGVEKKQWLTSGQPCAICAQWEADNPDPIPMGEPFRSQGQTTMIADAHPNDRCDIVPVLAEDEAEYETLVGRGPLEAV